MNVGLEEASWAIQSSSLCFLAAVCPKGIWHSSYATATKRPLGGKIYSVLLVKSRKDKGIINAKLQPQQGINRLMYASVNLREGSCTALQRKTEKLMVLPDVKSGGKS